MSDANVDWGQQLQAVKKCLDKTKYRIAATGHRLANPSSIVLGVVQLMSAKGGAGGKQNRLRLQTP